MITTTLYMFLACTPLQNSICTRDYNPVCGNQTTYQNICIAESNGFYGYCRQFLKNGKCSEEAESTCEETETFSEKGFCVTKPWSDFVSCEIEKNQGACPEGADPNNWVAEHCARTCNAYIRINRDSDRA